MSTKADQQVRFVDQMASRDNRSNRTARFLEKLGKQSDRQKVKAP
jgi:hypothetical protein